MGWIRGCEWLKGKKQLSIFDKAIIELALSYNRIDGVIEKSRKKMDKSRFMSHKGQNRNLPKSSVQFLKKTCNFLRYDVIDVTNKE